MFAKWKKFTKTTIVLIFCLCTAIVFYSFTSALFLQTHFQSTNFSNIQKTNLNLSPDTLLSLFLPFPCNFFISYSISSTSFSLLFCIYSETIAVALHSTLTALTTSINLLFNHSMRRSAVVVLLTQHEICCCRFVVQWTLQQCSIFALFLITCDTWKLSLCWNWSSLNDSSDLCKS